MTDSTPDEPGRNGGVARVLVIGAAVLAVLLLGAAVGLLVQLPNADRGSTPDASSVAVGFCQDMAQHHLQGVQMANIARDRSTDAKVRGLAFDIASTQLEQIGRMKGWLMLWNEPEQVNEHMKWMTGNPGHHSAAAGEGVAVMPGMATADELAKLRSLSGNEFDVYFLQLMLRHHQGGAPMAEYATQHAEQQVVRTLAENMLKSQSHENDLMKQWLADRGAAPLS
jgi:uncharacterized protein (DUF305 family)